MGKGPMKNKIPHPIYGICWHGLSLNREAFKQGSRRILTGIEKHAQLRAYKHW